jgi:hypothetical protein
VNSCTEGTFGCGGGDTANAYEQVIADTTKKASSHMTTAGVASAAMVPYTQSM